MMRNVLLFCGLFFSMFPAFSQSGRFPIHDNSKWKLIYYQNLTKEGVSKKPDEHYYYETSGDTLINNKSYYKVYKSGVMYFVNPAVTYHRKYQAAIRSEDTKVFCIKAGKTSETLLYDYNLKIGDTIKAEVANGYEITDIDTLQDGRRVFKFYMTFRCGEEIIEGVGSNSDLFEMNRCFHSGIVGKVLTSFSINGKLVFSGDAVDKYNVERNSEKVFQPNYNSTWRVSKFKYDPVFSSAQQYTYVNGDTLINGLKYFALYETGLITYSDTSPKLYGKKYYGAIRSDEYKLYFVPEKANTETLMYDFDLKVGDMIRSYIYKDSIVTKIDTIADGRRKFYLGSGFNEGYIIEGIGSDYKLCDTSADEYFECYSEKGVPIVYNFDCTACINDYTKNLYANDQLQVSHQSKGEYSLSGNTHFGRTWSAPQPVISKTEVERIGNMIAIHAYYNMGEPSDEVHEFDVPIPSISLGVLPNGQYELVYMAHTVEYGMTTYNYKMNRILFNVSGLVDNIHANNVENGLFVSPNPASNRITLRCNNGFSQIVSLAIYNAFGTKVLEKNFFGNKQFFIQDISVENLKSGIYIVKVQSGNKSANSKLIIKR